MINNHEEYIDKLARLNQLLDLIDERGGEHLLTDNENDEIDALSLEIEDWENDHYAI